MNDIIAASNTNRHSYNGFKKQWEEAVFYACKAQKIKPVEQAYFIFTWIEANRRRDKDNIRAFAKFALDGLVTAGILKSDGWRHVKGFKDHYAVDKDGQGVIITIRGVDKDENEHGRVNTSKGRE